jgi:hypothetical protein
VSILRTSLQVIRLTLLFSSSHPFFLETPTKSSSKKPIDSPPLHITNLEPIRSIVQEPSPGPVTPNQKTLLLSAHNLVIGHPKAPEFKERVTDDVVAGYSDVVKQWVY